MGAALPIIFLVALQRASALVAPSARRPPLILAFAELRSEEIVDLGLLWRGRVRSAFALLPHFVQDKRDQIRLN